MATLFRGRFRIAAMQFDEILIPEIAISTPIMSGQNAEMTALHK